MTVKNYSTFLNGVIYPEFAIPLTVFVFFQVLVDDGSSHHGSSSMADYNYITNGCLEFTIKLGCCKYPGGI
jgi:hypothetical protein